MTTAPSLKPGDRVWRIGVRSLAPLRCIVMRVDSAGSVWVRPSTFAKNSEYMRAEDVFADREACRAEIVRRRGKEATDV
jgi:hypothetical protein